MMETSVIVTKKNCFKREGRWPTFDDKGLDDAWVCVHSTLGIYKNKEKDRLRRWWRGPIVAEISFRVCLWIINIRYENISLSENKKIKK